MKHIAILGSTGSIGTQALQVIRENPDMFRVSALSAGNNAELLIQQAREFNPLKVVIGDEQRYDEISKALADTDIEVFAGEDAMVDLVKLPVTDVVLTAVVGFCGLRPTIAAIEAGKHIALANKETLVVAGEMINMLIKRHNVSILPVDSEHSAIFQCLQGESANRVEKIYLTASGGPFRGKSREFLSTVTRKEALKHPNWVMGAKITIDSASLMNKGLEVIEAKWLFDLEASQIDVIVHPQSVIHSIVQFEDGSMKAQMGLPDMKLPIQYALGYPKRILNTFPRFDFLKYDKLTFEQPDRLTFRNLEFAFEAMRRSGNTPCVMNAANEIAVSAFLNGRLGFLQMSDVIEKCMSEVPYIRTPNLTDLIETDEETRKVASKLVTNY